MPGPGRSKSAKSKSKTKPLNGGTQNSPVVDLTPDAYIGDIHNSLNWHSIVNILCQVLEIPDLTTRSGLRKVHANFESIYRRIEKAYLKYPDNVKVAGGIVGIYSKMSADAILRDKIFDRGLLSKLMPLLEIDESRHLALRSLGTITHAGGTRIRVAIAKQAPLLTSLIDKHPYDAILCELTVMVLSHSLCAVMSGATPHDPETLATLDIPTILRAITEASQMPAATPYLVEHAVQFHAVATLPTPAAYKAYPPAIKFLVAGLRSKDWIFRCCCLGGIIRLHRAEAEGDQRQLDPYKLISSIERGFPSNITSVLANYGRERCETFIMLRASVDFQKAMMKAAQDHDIYSLGLKLAEIILRTEFSIADGTYQSPHPVTGEMEVMDVGLPFKTWAEALPICAKTIRLRRRPEEADAADILDIKYLIMRGRLREAISLAKASMVRSPENAYFYYAVTLSADNVDGLKAAKKGLKCKKITPFVRFQLLQRAVEHAGDMGIVILQDSPTAGEQKWEEGIAFLLSAWEDAKTFVAEAPPDNRYMKNVLYWLILLTLTIQEEEIGPDMKDIQPLLAKLVQADTYSTFIGIPPPKTNMRLAQQTAVKYYPAAIKEFGHAIDKASPPTDAEESVTDLKAKAEDDLAAWLEDMRLDSDSVVKEAVASCSHPKVSANHVAMYRCSWCGNPSVLLKKCSGCSKTRYCDSGCQKSHWGAHKKACQAAASA